MTETAIEPTAASTVKYDVVHVECCEAEDATLCGLDAPDYEHERLQDDAETTCAVCAELEPLPCQAFCSRARGW